jgi:hypothetical protein
MRFYERVDVSPSTRGKQGEMPARRTMKEQKKHNSRNTITPLENNRGERGNKVFTTTAPRRRVVLIEVCNLMSLEDYQERGRTEEVPAGSRGIIPLAEGSGEAEPHQKDLWHRSEALLESELHRNNG